MLINGPNNASTGLLLAHSAGAGMDTAFMNHVAEKIAAEGIRVWRFEFPYMAQRRADGIKRPPNKLADLVAHFEVVLEQIRDQFEGIYIGGKSMGGRIASLLATEHDVAGCICLGYPFHPASKPERTRTSHLGDIRVPTLILQGDRDRLGKPEEIASYDLPETIDVRFVADGDHSFKPRARSNHTHEENLDFAVRQVVDFMHRGR